jgi:hypothetical protein
VSLLKAADVTTHLNRPIDFLDMKKLNKTLENIQEEKVTNQLIKWNVIWNLSTFLLTTMIILFPNMRTRAKH